MNDRKLFFRRSILPGPGRQHCQARFHFPSGGAAISKPEQPRINRQIREKEVRLIGEDGSQIGIVPIDEAIRRAEEATLDLVEVAPEAKPPVCRIFDYKKVIYEKKKKLKESKKKATVTHLKEVKLRVAIDEHDRDFKIKKARKFLEKGDKVKFTIVFRGREITKPELGEKLIGHIREDLKDIAEVEQPPSKMGRQVNFIVGRRKEWKPTAPAKGASNNSKEEPDDDE